jgi:hypothetical protein
VKESKNTTPDLMGALWKRDLIPSYVMVVFLVLAAVKGIWIRFSDIITGDEYFYLLEVKRLFSEGILATMTRGSSILFTALSALLSYITGDLLLSNRLLSLLPGLFAVWSIWKMARLWGISREPRLLLVFTLLTFLFDPERSPFLFGTNDAMLFALIAEGLYQLFRFLEFQKWNYLIGAGLLFGAGFWVREIHLMYLLPVAGGAFLYLVIPSEIRILRKTGQSTLFFSIVLLTAVLVHIPSLITNGKPGFEDKDYMGNWRERDYLTQIMRKPSGSVFAYERAEWSEVEAWKQSEKNPALPGTRLDIWKADPVMAADRFSSNLLIRCTYLFSLRNGVLFILFLASFWMIKKIRESGRLKHWLLLILMISGYTLMISAITLHRIEIRWLALTIMFVALAGTFILEILRNHQSKWYRYCLWAQYIFIGLSLLKLLIL